MFKEIFSKALALEIHIIIIIIISIFQKTKNEQSS